ncbi:unnamed protein product [Lactuca virosa]|uniref:Uncharacterized protein n=1 Tax=Lactuca virosa TaxID=75947 RepID=A0AAU9P8G1_9ASTR|nr:unnamed protein product [Lactuca virosa]
MKAASVVRAVGCRAHCSCSFAVQTPQQRRHQGRPVHRRIAVVDGNDVRGRLLTLSDVPLILLLLVRVWVAASAYDRCCYRELPYCCRRAAAVVDGTVVAVSIHHRGWLRTESEQRSVMECCCLSGTKEAAATTEKWWLPTQKPF